MKASTAGLAVGVICPSGRLAMTQPEAKRRAGRWCRWLRITMHDYRCPLCEWWHFARPVR